MCSGISAGRPGWRPGEAPTHIASAAPPLTPANRNRHGIGFAKYLLINGVGNTVYGSEERRVDGKRRSFVLCVLFADTRALGSGQEHAHRDTRRDQPELR